MDNIAKIDICKEKVLKGKSLNQQDAAFLLSLKGYQLYYLFNAALQIRSLFLGEAVHLCAIANARSGACSEDCAFCAQSSFHKAKINAYPLMAVERIYRKAKHASQIGAGYFCIVASGRRITDKKDFKNILKMIRKIRAKLKVNVDASLGELSLDEAMALRDAGLLRYNHNLETAKSLYQSLCSTHSYSDRMRTIDNIKKSGLELCCGAILGMGETVRQRIELLLALREIQPHCLPVNFLNPIYGTRFAHKNPAPPLELLKFVSVLRLFFPEKEIKICGGREKNLRSLQPLLFLAGANSIIIGGYLTTSGNPPKQDLQMIKDLGLSASN